MGKQYADVCDGCGRTVVKVGESGSSDMIRAEHFELLYLSDKYLPNNKLSRPSLTLTGNTYCPGCFIEQVTKWVSSLSSLEPSKIRTVVDEF